MDDVALCSSSGFPSLSHSDEDGQDVAGEKEDVVQMMSTTAGFVKWFCLLTQQWPHHFLHSHSDRSGLG